MPEFLATRTKVHADVTNCAQSFILFLVQF